MQLAGNRASEFLCVRVEGKGALHAIGNFGGTLAAAVRRGKNHRQIAGEVLDVLVLAKLCLPGERGDLRRVGG